VFHANFPVSFQISSSSPTGCHANSEFQLHKFRVGLEKYLMRHSKLDRLLRLRRFSNDDLENLLSFLRGKTYTFTVAQVASAHFACQQEAGFHSAGHHPVTSAHSSTSSMHRSK
jgi:hypothetical protein